MLPTLDAASVPGAHRKPIVLPPSLVPFPPVRALDAAAYPLAIVTGPVGIEFRPAATVLPRAGVPSGGFGLAAIRQAVLASIVVEAIWSR